MANQGKSERVWRTVSEGARTIDGNLGTWRTVEATEDKKSMGFWVEIGTRKSRVFMPRTMFEALVRDVETAFKSTSEVP